MIEKDDISAAIRDSGGNISKAARRLGVSRRTLQNRMRHYGMPRGQAGRRKRRISYSRHARAYAAVATVAAIGVSAAALYKKRRGTSA